MQQISPKDRPKLIAICVALVGVVGFGVKTTMDTMATVSGSKSQPAPAALPAVEGVTSANPSPTVPDAPNAYVLRNSYDDRSRDPFTPVSDREFILRSVKSASFTGQKTAPVAAGNVGVIGRPTFQAFQRGLAQAERQIPDFSAVGKEIGNVGTPPAMVVPPPTFKVLPPPPPPYAVVGVLIGEGGGRDVAILSRSGGGDRKFVVAGDPLEGGYTVTAIESGGVRVTHPGRRSASGGSVGAVPMNGSTEYYLPKQTATSLTLPLGDPSKPGASTNAAGIR